MKIVLFLLSFASFLSAQVSVSNLAEYQVGNLPHSEPGDLSTLFNQMTLEYRQSPITVGLRLENFQSSVGERSYNYFAQRYVQWRNGRVKVRLGHFNTTLGRGLVLRAFELPSVVFEQRHFRRRYAYNRDIDGVLAQGSWRRFEFTVLHGSPLNETIPPGLEESRRSGIVQGGQVNFRPTQWLMLGDAYLRAEVDHASQKKNEMNSLFGELNVSHFLRQQGLERSSLKLYVEHARSNTLPNEFFSAGATDDYATYVNLIFSYKRLGLSAEYKDYNNFENGVNVPPIGYMEHGYYLLNRSTHELLAENESGWQVEATYRPAPSLFILANNSYALNDFPGSRFEFSENMLEITFTPPHAVSGKAFFNHAKDELRGELKRLTAGVNVDWQFSDKHAVSVDVQHQNIDRGFDGRVVEALENSYATLTLSSSPRYSFSIIAQRSTDTAETDDPATPTVTETDPQMWLSVSGAYQIDMNHELSFFYGARRGGLACTSGACYEVLPFEGFELRWMARL